MGDGFLGRWSQRKQAVRRGQPVTEPAAQAETERTDAAPRAGPVPAGAVLPDPAPPQDLVAQVDAVQPAEPPPLTMQDVEDLSQDSDFKPFVARTVAPQVRNAALKKLFSNPHFSLIDRLDVYIDDYSKPDPLPESMLRKMASAKFLKLFEEDEDASQPAIGDDAHTPAPQTVAQSALAQDASPVPKTDEPDLTAENDHSDLRLQPDHATGPARPGRVSE